MDGLTPGSGAGQVHQMQNDPPRLAVELTVNQAGTLNLERDVVFGSPANQVREQVAVIRKIVAPKAAVEVKSAFRASPARNTFGGASSPLGRGFISCRLSHFMLDTMHPE